MENKLRVRDKEGIEEQKAYQELKERRIGFLMQIIITFVVLIAGLYLLIGITDEVSKRFGASFVGATIGYWLK